MTRLNGVGKNSTPFTRIGVASKAVVEGISPSPSDRPRLIFTVWTLMFAIVGAQMGWILRPFIGAPSRPFELFRERDSNFFEALMGVLRQLFQ